MKINEIFVVLIHKQEVSLSQSQKCFATDSEVPRGDTNVKTEIHINLTFTNLKDYDHTDYNQVLFDCTRTK